MVMIMPMAMIKSNLDVAKCGMVIGCAVFAPTIILRIVKRATVVIKINRSVTKFETILVQETVIGCVFHATITTFHIGRSASGVAFLRLIFLEVALALVPLLRETPRIRRTGFA